MKVVYTPTAELAAKHRAYFQAMPFRKVVREHVKAYQKLVAHYTQLARRIAQASGTVVTKVTALPTADGLELHVKVKDPDRLVDRDVNHVFLKGLQIAYRRSRGAAAKNHTFTLTSQPPRKPRQKL